MTRSWSFCLWALAVIAAMEAAADASRVFKVGDDFGWRVPFDNDPSLYSHWATSKRFHIGDSLSFVYRNDSVVEVDKWGFYHCNGSDPIVAFDNGNSTVKLNRPGPFYFISGVTDRCRSGQRLIVEVMHFHRHHHHHASPPSSMTASSFPSMAPSSPLSSPHSSSPHSHTLSASVLLGLPSFAAVVMFVV
ncbi:PREDICTED: mavicyanin [Tarenaya hassleriana]|uniref:mavicyanin n=1 Tax=Tarenaya hassleriana TaxID=28532 RepID=UPI00053C658F|nr:PREDICTED: mavicyanin [Tarenaya hassleriana]